MLLIVLAGGGLLAVGQLKRPAPVAVAGDLSGFTGISFTEGAPREGGVSPVCGCVKPPYDAWRGITFAGHAASITRTGRSSYTQWILSPAEPDSVSLVGGEMRLTVEAFRLQPNDEFNPKWLLHPSDLSRHARVLLRTQIHGSDLNLVSGNTLHVAMLAKVPIAAWVPYPGSKVSLGRRTNAFPSQQPEPQLTEVYPEDLGNAAKTQAERAQGYPLGDFLGPDVVVWSEDDETHVAGTSLVPTKDESITALIVRNSTFSTRIGVVPATESELTRSAKASKGHPRAASQDIYPGNWDHGHIVVTDEAPLSASAYGQARKRLQRSEFTKTHYVLENGRFINEHTGKPEGAEIIGGPGVVEERYPPLPQNAGFNVFGPMSELAFANAEGSLVIGATTQIVGAPSEVELHDVRALHSLGEVETIPIPLSATSHVASLKFSAVGTVAINGSDQTSFFVRHRVLLEIAGFVMALLGLMLSAVSCVASFRNTPAA